MDSHPLEAKGASRIADDSRDALAFSARTFQDPEEHAESPMRKRPRLDGAADDDRNCTAQTTNMQVTSGDTPSSASSSHHSNDALSSPPSLSSTLPSKVTLSLRSPDTSPSKTFSRRNISIDKEDGSDLRRGDSSPISETMIVPVESSREPSVENVVDINLDDTEDMDVENGEEREASIHRDFEDQSSQERSKILAKFPAPPFLWAKPYDAPASKAKKWKTALTEASDSALTPDALLPLQSWICDEFLPWQDRMDDCSWEIYSGNVAFWQDLAAIFCCILREKPSLWYSITGQTLGSVTILFAAYMQLCGPLLAHDVAILNDSSETEEPPIGLHTEHLANMYWMVHRAPLWIQLEHKKINVFQIYHQLAISLFDEEATTILTLCNLIKVLLADVKLASKHTVELERSVFVAFRLLETLSHFTRRAKFDNPIYDTGLGALLSAAQGLDEFLQCVVEKKSAPLPNEIILTISPLVADMFRYIADVSVPDVAMMLKDDFGPFEQEIFSDFPFLAGSCVSLRLAWKTLTTGRMELRAASVETMAKRLVDIWNQINQRHMPSSRNPALVMISRWLQKIQAVEYLSSESSHPQLISRSDNIVGFLLATHTWSDKFTDTFWHAIVSNADHRIAEAMWKMLSIVTHLMEPVVLSSFAQKITQLSTAQFSSEMLQFVAKLGEALVTSLSSIHREYTLNGTYQDPLVAYITLACESAYWAKAETNCNLVQSMHHHALEHLAKFAKVTGPEVRQPIYLRCIDDIATSPERALGSVEAVEAMSRESTDLDFLLHNTLLFETLAQAICSLHERESAGSPSESYCPLELGPILSLFLRLLQMSGCPSLAPDLQQDIWLYLVGEKACTDAARQMAWMHMSGVQMNPPTQIVEMWINEMLPRLSSQYFTLEMLQFLHKYISQDRSLLKESTMEVPFAHIFWNVLLNADSEAVTNRAISVLTELYTHHRFRQDSKLAIELEALSNVHVQLVDDCMAKLEYYYQILRADPSTMTMNGDMSPSKPNSTLVPKAAQAKLAFKRIMLFLNKFTGEVQQRPDYVVGVESGSSPLEVSEKYGSGNMVQLEYEVFAPGEYGRKRRIEIDESATYDDLGSELRSFLGFTKLSVIFQGAYLDLEDNKSDTVSNLVHKGLLLVMDKDHGPSSILTHANGVSAAEQALIAHHDALFGYLDLKQELAYPVARLLSKMPPHPSIRQMMLEDKLDLTLLFPPSNPIKTAYAIKAMNKELRLQSRNRTRSDEFIGRGVKALTDALTNPLILSDMVGNEHLMNVLLDGLASFLRERMSPESPVDISLAAETASTLFDWLDRGMDEEHGGTLDLNLVYSCLMESSLLNADIWASLKASPRMLAVHRWLLVEQDSPEKRERAKHIIKNICHEVSSPAGVSACELIGFYWKVLSPTILSMQDEFLRCEQLLETTAWVFDPQNMLSFDEATLRDFLESWTSILNNYSHNERPGQPRDALVNGMIGLLTKCVSHLATFKKAISYKALPQLLLDKYLFPALPQESMGMLSSHATKGPIIDSETRKKMYDIVIRLCEDKPDCISIIDVLLRLDIGFDLEHEIGFQTDRNRWLRTSLGYSGLRNLTNTCYMNSLVTQLFMNIDFRAFMLNTEPSANANLLKETQSLFAHMQTSYSKWADTANFARSIRPYDSDQIDVSIQMDVDEFYNLLFDRWEEQMPSAEAKQQFRSFYGGQTVMQIQSHDCEHVSERVEPFFALQLEVKGKTDLHESLNAYVEGDAMEGDNKYKCESCNGRFVNARKRTCLKELPDNLIMHLKRFDFNLTLGERHKINDLFRFPNEIDMNQYTVDAINNSGSPFTPDLYELVGVLVHLGTAETGHYYSYLRLPNDSSGRPLWAEFNDIEVSQVDSDTIGDKSFGGPSGNPNPSLRSDNAYMLFYRRVGRQIVPKTSETQLQPTGPIIMPTSMRLQQEIAISNVGRLRQYCLFDSAHADFVKSIGRCLKKATGGSCSSDHELEETALTSIMLHVYHFFSRNKDLTGFHAVLVALKEMSADCGQCSIKILSWILRCREYASGTPEETLAFRKLLLFGPAETRRAWAGFLTSTLRNIRDLEIDSYGYPAIDIANNSETFTAVLLHNDHTASWLRKFICVMYETRYYLADCKRSWDEYFLVLNNIAAFGTQEIVMLLSYDLFGFAMFLVRNWQVVRMEKPGQYTSEPFCETLWRNRKTLTPFAQLTRFIHFFLSNVDPSLGYPMDAMARINDYDEELNRFPMTQNELDWFSSRPSKGGGLFWLQGILDLWRIHVPMVDSENQRNDSLEPETTLAESLNSYVGHGPSQIVRQLLGYCPWRSKRLELDLGNSLSMTMRESLFSRDPYELRATLIVVETICLESPNHGIEASDLIEVVARKAAWFSEADLDNFRTSEGVYEYCEQGASHFFDFFERLSQAFVRHADGRIEHPFLVSLIGLVHIWGPPLLLHSEAIVRSNIEGLIAKTIFDAPPQTTLDDTEDFGTESDGLTELDYARIAAVKPLYFSCKELVQRAERDHNERLDIRILTEIISILTQCASWCEKLVLDRASASSISSNHDVYNGIVSDFKRKDSGLQDKIARWPWGRDAEDTSFDTEYEEYDDVDESDASTEA